jgi:hypothetical protein
MEHLLIGFVISVVFYLYFKNVLVIPYTLIFSIFPDIFDKIFGYLLFGTGRALFHTVIIVIVFFIAYILCKIKGNMAKEFSIIVFISGIAILGHQLADSMWLMPRTWFWPFLGNFKVKSYEVVPNILYKIHQELAQPNEIFYTVVFILGLVLIFLFIRSGYNKQRIL